MFVPRQQPQFFLAPGSVRVPAQRSIHPGSIPTSQPQQQEIEAWLSVSAQEQRHHRLGLSKPNVASFVQDCEFVSLGSYCGVARALQCTGLKQLTYPFDWTRCPMEGVIRCLETRFEDFLTYSVKFDHKDAGSIVYGGSRWGGSFWHHDPEDAQIKIDMARRIERLYSPQSATRLFVRAANSSAELQDCVRLRDALCRALPNTKVYLLVLVDCQVVAEPISIIGEECLLVFRIHESVSPADGKWTMQRQAEAYAEALAFALRLWAGEGLAGCVKMVPDIRAACNICNDFVGTDPATELWLPQKPTGHRRCISEKQASIDSNSDSAIVQSGHRRSLSAPMPPADAESFDFTKLHFQSGHPVNRTSGLCTAKSVSDPQPVQALSSTVHPVTPPLSYRLSIPESLPSPVHPGTPRLSTRLSIEVPAESLSSPVQIGTPRLSSGSGSFQSSRTPESLQSSTTPEQGEALLTPVKVEAAHTTPMSFPVWPRGFSMTLPVRPGVTLAPARGAPSGYPTLLTNSGGTPGPLSLKSLLPQTPLASHRELRLTQRMLPILQPAY